MSVNRICRCGEQESIRFNFGNDLETEQRISCSRIYMYGV